MPGSDADGAVPSGKRECPKNWCTHSLRFPELRAHLEWDHNEPESVAARLTREAFADGDE